MWQAACRSQTYKDKSDPDPGLKDLINKWVIIMISVVGYIRCLLVFNKLLQNLVAQNHFYYLTVVGDQESRCGLARSSVSRHLMSCRQSAGLGSSHLKAQLGGGPLPNSHIWVLAGSSMSRFLAGGGPKASLSSLPLWSSSWCEAGFHQNEQAGEKGVRWAKQGSRRLESCCKLDLEVVSHRFLCVRSESLGPAHTQREGITLGVTIGRDGSLGI